ncbi:MAG: amidohydrolase [Pigmentiphaga sp.]|nr:amidohydrolase [Pigmentiphaga sp.]
MIDDIFIFDNVIHLSDMSTPNLRDDIPDAKATRDRIVRQISGLRWPGPPPRPDPDFDWTQRWEVEDMYELVFKGSPTDMAMAQVVPMFDWFKEWESPITLQYAMAKAYPERVMFCGGVDPRYRGLDDALEQIDYQAREMGARSFKFYNAHERLEDCWRCDDEKLAYPMYERALAAGVDVLQFHKGNPWGQQNMEKLSPVDLQAPARDFPQITFIVHHLALPYFEEMVSIAARFPNVYLSMAGYMSFYRFAPRRVQEYTGRLLQACGAEKLLWGSEAALAGGPTPSLEAFMSLEIPDDLRNGYGYPQITRADKKKILGENFARLMHVDIVAKQQELAALGRESRA